MLADEDDLVNQKLSMASIPVADEVIEEDEVEDEIDVDPVDQRS